MDNKKIKELVKQVHDNAVKHGWHDEEHSKEHYLMLIITEVCEMVDADRCGRHAKKDDFIERMNREPKDEAKEMYEQNFYYAFKSRIKETVEDEMADVCIRILDMAGEYCLDLDLNLPGIYNSSNEEFTYRCYNLVTYLADWDLVDDDDHLAWHLSIILVALSQWAEHDGIDLDWHIQQKMKFNALRPYKHGGKKY